MPLDHKLLQSIRLKIALLARALHNVAVDRARLHRAIGRQMQRVDELDYRLRELWARVFRGTPTCA